MDRYMMLSIGEIILPVNNLVTQELDLFFLDTLLKYSQISPLKHIAKIIYLFPFI